MELFIVLYEVHYLLVKELLPIYRTKVTSGIDFDLIN